MSKNIEMNYKTESGYEVTYPKSISDICLSSDELKTLFSLNDESVVDDAFEYVNRQLILMKYNKAGINVAVKSAGGSPLEGVPIPNITANYDGTGEVVTGSDGTAFGYCDAGSVNITPVACADITYTSQNVQTLVGEMYNVEITGTVINFVKWTSTTVTRFSNNVQSVDVCCVGAGGGGAQTSQRAVAGGGGGYVTVKEDCDFVANNNFNIVVGSGGQGARESDNSTGNDTRGTTGGTSSFLNVTASGGEGGVIRYGGNYWNSWVPPKGNGNGGYIQGRDTVVNPTEGNSIGYYSYTQTGIYGGGGGASYDNNGNGTINTTSTKYGAGKNPGGGGYYYKVATPGFGGGGSTYDGTYEGMNIVVGGSGCVAIRMHLKVTS